MAILNCIFLYTDIHLLIDDILMSSKDVVKQEDNWINV